MSDDVLPPRVTGTLARRPLAGLPEPLGRLIVPVARIWALAALLAFVVMGRIEGIPQGPEGGSITGTLQGRLQVVLLVVAALSIALAWRWPGLGGSVLVVAAIAIGAFAGFEYAPLIAFLAAAAFLAPACLFLLTALRHRTAPVVILTSVLLAALLAGGGVAAWAAYDYSFGPAHPESSLGASPAGDVEWAWSGAITPTSARVVTKLAGTGEESRLVVSPREDLSGARRVVPERVSDEVTAFEVTGLRPRTRYHYAVEVDGRVDRVRAGRFRTFPDGPGSFTVALGSCSRRGSNGAVYDAIRGVDPDLFLVTGDWYYGNIDQPDGGAFRGAYDTTLTRPAQQALYLSAPTAYVWDDHDFGPNDADSTSPAAPAAQEVYRERVPHYPLAADGPAGGIGQAFTIGRVRFLLADLRSQRSPKGAADGPGKTMLGDAQKRWLARELRQAPDRHPLVVLVSSVPWIAAESAGSDSWGGYATERREVADMIARAQSQGVRVAIVAGDAHMVALDDGTNSDYSRSGGAAVPVFHAAALDRRAEVKGGPYSGGTFPGPGQFGTIRVNDDGGDIDVTLKGLDWTGRELVSHRFRVPARPGGA